MLILTRREGESVTIRTPSGEEIKVVVSQIKGSQMRLGFLAPKSVVIERFDEEQKVEHELLIIKKRRNANCSNKDFLKVWMDTPIPQLGASAREIVRSQPNMVDKVIEVLKKELG